jgi:hypothetical protein
MEYANGRKVRLSDSVRIGGDVHAQVIAVIDEDTWGDESVHGSFDEWRHLDRGVLLCFPSAGTDRGTVQYRESLSDAPTIVPVLQCPEAVTDVPEAVGPFDAYARYEIELSALGEPAEITRHVVTSRGGYKAMVLAGLNVETAEAHFVDGVSRWDALRTTRPGTDPPRFTEGKIRIVDVSTDRTAHPSDIIDPWEGGGIVPQVVARVVGEPGQWGSPYGPTPRYTFEFGLLGHPESIVMRVSVSQGAGRAAVMAAWHLITESETGLEDKRYIVTRLKPEVRIDTVTLTAVEWNFKPNPDDLRMWDDYA